MPSQYWINHHFELEALITELEKHPDQDRQFRAKRIKSLLESEESRND